MIPGQTDADPQDAPQPAEPAMSGLLDQPRAQGEGGAAGSGGCGASCGSASVCRGIIYAG